MPDTTREAYIEMLIPILRANEGFTDLSDDELRQFAGAAKFRHEAQGTRIIQQGKPGDEFFVVLSGQLRAIDVSYDPPHLLNYHDAGQIVGARALLRNAPRAASVEVVIDARLAIYNGQDWEWLTHRLTRIVNYFENLELEFEQRSLIEFPGRQWDEVVVASTKRHILALLAKLSLPFTLLIVPILFLISGRLLGITFLSDITNSLLALLIIVPFLVLSTLLAIYHFIDWRNDDFILTSKRFIHIERRLFYGEERHEAPLTRIQDVTLSYPGFLDRVDFFNLRIKTAGAGDIYVNGIIRAQQILDRIFEEKARAVARVQAANVAAIRQLLAEELEWEDALDEEPILAIAEPEGEITIRSQTHRLPVLINYFWPRIQEVDVDGVTIIWHKHYWVLLGAIILPLLLSLLFFYLLLASFLLLPPFGTLATWPVRIGLGIALLVSFLWYLWKYDGWHRDVYLVTDTRVVDVESSPFRLRGERRSEGTFDDIQNITYDIPNFVSNLLNLGNVVIETAGTKDTFTFDKVFNPGGIQQEIFKRMVLVQQRARENRRDATTQQLLKVLGEYQYLLERATSKGIVELVREELEREQRQQRSDGQS